MRSSRTWNLSVLLLLVAVAAYFQTWLELWPYWEHKDATYTHGTLIAATTVWLIWRTRPALQDVAATPSPVVLFLVLLLSPAWLLAARANMFIVHALLWPVLTFTILWAGVGWRAASKLAFALGFLYFAIPAWDYLKPPLQAISSVMVGFLTSLVGVPALVEGPHVVLPDHTIYIALDCSGAHFLCVSLAVGALAGEMRGDNLRTRLMIMGLAALLSMVFNWLRILLIVLAYLNPNLKHSLETMGHYTFGWWVFAFDLIVFYLVLRLIPLREKVASTPVAADNPGRSSLAVAYPLAVLVALLLPASSWAVHRFGDYTRLTSNPIVIPGASGPIAPDAVWNPHFEGAAWEHRVAYIWNAGRIVELYRNEYYEQSQGKELISRGSRLFDPASFVSSRIELVQLDVDAGSRIDANHTELIDKSGRRWLALYLYIVENETFASERHVQLLTALRSLYGHPTAGVLGVMTLCGPNCDDADAAMEHVLIRAYSAYHAAHRQS